MERVLQLPRACLVWDTHAGMQLHPGDTSFLPQMERVRAAGADVVSLNKVGVGGVSRYRFGSREERLF
jgi:hypothetical protein